MIWRRRASRSARCRVASSGSGRGTGLTPSPKRAMTSASMASVFARCPAALAKARILAGSTMMTGRPAAASVAATTVSKPPVASTITRAGLRGPSRAMRRSRPLALRSTVKCSPPGRTAMSSCFLETSTPTLLSMTTRPCLIGLASRPRRLFGLDGTTGGAPCSPTVFEDPGAIGHPPITARSSLPETRGPKLQGAAANAGESFCPSS